MDGLWVRSHGEQRIADWLSRRGVPFQYEPKVCGKRPDFRIEGHKVLVEYWGGAGFPDYEARMLAKIERFEADGWTVVSLFSIHLHELEQVLERELRNAGVAT